MGEDEITLPQINTDNTIHLSKSVYLTCEAIQGKQKVTMASCMFGPALKAKHLQQY
jgi:hypothetical protein